MGVRRERHGEGLGTAVLDAGEATCGTAASSISR